MIKRKGINIKILPEISVVENKSEAYSTYSRDSKTQKVSMNKNKEIRKRFRVHGNPKYLKSKVIKVSDILWARIKTIMAFPENLAQCGIVYIFCQKSISDPATLINLWEMENYVKSYENRRLDFSNKKTSKIIYPEFVRLIL